MKLCWHKWKFNRKFLVGHDSILLIFSKGPHFYSHHIEHECVKCGKIKQKKISRERYDRT